MNVENIRDYCLLQFAVTEEMPFGPDFLVFKVGGKIFLLLGLNQIGSLCFNVKCDPDRAAELRSLYLETVFPAYHMNKKHWNTVYCNRELSDDQIKGFILASYALVYRSLSNRIKESLSSTFDEEGD